MSAIVIDKVSMVFNLGPGSDVHALNNVSLDIKQGEMVSVLGPSGCGKTTLLNIVAGFLSPTSGEVRLDNKPVTGPGAERGVVFQQGALFEWLSVEDNIGFGPRMAGRPKGETSARVERLLQTVTLAALRQSRSINSPAACSSVSRSPAASPMILKSS